MESQQQYTGGIGHRRRGLNQQLFDLTLELLNLQTINGVLLTHKSNAHLWLQLRSIVQQNRRRDDRPGHSACPAQCCLGWNEDVRDVLHRWFACVNVS